MVIGRRALAITTVAVWAYLLLGTFQAKPMSVAVIVSLFGTMASVWIALSGQRRLSMQASVVLQSMLLLTGGFFVVVVMASSAG